MRLVLGHGLSPPCPRRTLAGRAVTRRADQLNRIEAVLGRLEAAVEAQGAEVRAIRESAAEVHGLSTEVHRLTVQQVTDSAALRGELGLVLRAVIPARPPAAGTAPVPVAAGGDGTGGETKPPARRTPKTTKPKQEPK